MGNNNIVHELVVTIEETNVPDKYLHCFNSTFINSYTGWRPAGGGVTVREAWASLLIQLELMVLSSQLSAQFRCRFSAS